MKGTGEEVKEKENGTKCGIKAVSGRSRGFCIQTPAMGCGFGHGRGQNGCYRAGSYRRMRYARAYGHAEKEFLTARVAFLEEQLQRARARLKAMDEGARRE